MARRARLPAASGLMGPRMAVCQARARVWSAPPQRNTRQHCGATPWYRGDQALTSLSPEPARTGCRSARGPTEGGLRASGGRDSRTRTEHDLMRGPSDLGPCCRRALARWLFLWSIVSTTKDKDLAHEPPLYPHRQPAAHRRLVHAELCRDVLRRPPVQSDAAEAGVLTPAAQGAAEGVADASIGGL